MTGTGTSSGRLERRWAVLAAVIAIGHHVGVGLAPLGEVGGTGTRWADWADLLVPYLVVAAAAAVLLNTGTDGCGHWIWYVGLTIIVVVLVRATPRLGAPAFPVAWLFTLAAGFTWFDNTVEGGVPYLGLAAAVLTGAYALRRRVVPVAVAYAAALLLLITWAVWQEGFPQFSQVGWI